MTIPGTALLKRLEPAVRPLGAPTLRAGAFANETIDSADFAALLSRAERGEIDSERALAPTPLTGGFTKASLERIARAMDLLEARGARTALIAFGARTFIAALETRSFERELLAHDGVVPTRVDIAVRVPTMPGVSGRAPIGRWSSGMAQSLGPGRFSAGAVPPMSLNGWMSTEQTAWSVTASSSASPRQTQRPHAAWRPSRSADSSAAASAATWPQSGHGPRTGRPRRS
jgi:hypothetical protein